jgi:putative sigma-54 modulation protein
MRADIQSRGFSLTPALRGAVNGATRAYEARFPKLAAKLQVRLFDVNADRGGIDKGCLVHARVGRRGIFVVASDLDADLYRAIAAAFEKLERGTHRVLARERSTRHAAARHGDGRGHRTAATAKQG